MEVSRGAQIATWRVAALLTNNTSTQHLLTNTSTQRRVCLHATFQVDPPTVGKLWVVVLCWIVVLCSHCLNVRTVSPSLALGGNIGTLNIKFIEIPMKVLQDEQKDEIGVDYLAAWVRPGDHSVSLGWGVGGGFGGAIVVSCNRQSLNI